MTELPKVIHGSVVLRAASGDTPERFTATVPYGQDLPIRDASGRPSQRSERFTPGAFAAAPSGVPLLAQHDYSRTVALLDDYLDLNDKTALSVDMPLTAWPDTTEARDALARIRAGLYTGVSPRFVVRDSRREGSVEVIRAAELRELSLVWMPAYEAAQAAVRGASGTAPMPGGTPRRYWWW